LEVDDMAASLQDVRNWFQDGVAAGHRYLIVLCDTFAWEDYPRYAGSREEAQEIVDNPGNMTRVMEFYDLGSTMEDQIAWAALKLGFGAWDNS
jgi:hypothetical protein